MNTPKTKPRHVFICCGCGKSICEGDYYKEENGEQYCTICRPIEHKVAKYDDT